MSNNWLDIEDKIVIVTGGNSGIGKHIVEGLRAAKAQVACFDISVEDGVDAETGVFNLKVDVTDPEAVEAAVARVCEELGEVTTLVNNAGVNLPRLLVDVRGEAPQYELDTKSFDFMFNINVKGAFLMAQAVARRLIKAGAGTIVNVTSEAGSEGSKGQSAYSASKGAMNGFTLSWAKESARWGSASSVSPRASWSPPACAIRPTTMRWPIPATPRWTTSRPTTRRPSRSVGPARWTR